MNIYEVCDFGNLQIWDLDQIANKCVRLKYKNRYVIFPLISTHNRKQNTLIFIKLLKEQNNR